MCSSLLDLISNSAKRYPSRKALIEAETGKFVRYHELFSMLRSFSSGINFVGVKKGDRVGLFSNNSINSITVFLTVIKCGAIAVPFNSDLDIENIIRQAEDCGVSALCYSERFSKKAEEIGNRIKSIKLISEDSLAKNSVVHGQTSKGNLRAPAAIIYTSGSSGQPLGVSLSHENLICNNKAIVKYTKLSEKDRVCCVLPINYIYGLSLIISHLFAGASVVLENRFMYPKVVLDTLIEHDVSGFAGVSSHYSILLFCSDFKKDNISRMRYLLQAGDAMHPKITMALAGSFPDTDIYLMYGLTEASPRLSYLEPSKVRIKPTSVGRAVPGVKLKVVGRGGRECKIGEPGEVIASGKNIMLGYWNNRAETEKKIKNGWLYTGDIGFLDQEGDLSIIGRSDAMVKVGGHRVGLFEIERIVKGLSPVMDAVAVDFPDKILGNKIKLFVSPLPFRTIDSEEVMALCREKLAKYKVPSKVVVIESIPKNSSGKFDKEKLKGSKF